MYQALYRKYRPKTFDDVAGQAAITDTLKNEIATGKTSHAYLFTGLRGSGKTTCSKIIAKAVNCLNPVQGNPCCTCEICTGIDNDSITDVMEIDAASNSGVDYMRELREQAFYQPVRCKKRVYIIDETHMLSTEAFNALLKIMEEPPEHVLFILATTEVHKVPTTIISRCQRFDFGRIDSEIIADRLALIAKNEGFSIDRQAALMIARLSEGGMRDAISLLDQCWSRADEISLAVVASCAGLSSGEELFALAQSLQTGDCSASLVTLEQIVKSSTDLTRLCEQLIAHFRNLMIARCTDKLSSLVVCLPEELERYKTSAAQFSVSQLLFIIRCLQDTHTRMGRAPDKRVELEMAVVRVCQGDSSDNGALLERLQKLETALKNGVAARPPAALAPAAAPQRAAAPASPATPSPTAAPVPAEVAQKAVPLKEWDQVLEALKTKNKALYGALCDSLAYSSGELVLIHSKNELFLKLIRENDYAKQHLRDCIFKVTGQKCRLGPYRPERYSLQEEQAPAGDPLESMLKNAKELGVPLTVSGEDLP